jgi:hypothetical protein
MGNSRILVPDSRKKRQNTIDPIRFPSKMLGPMIF